MAAEPTAGTETARTPGYPFISDAAWWQLRKVIKTKGMPKVFDSDWVITVRIRENEGSAANIVRVFKRFGLFSSDGKPQDLAWDWIDDAKYPEACNKILHTVYPDALTGVFTTPSDEDRVGVERWFQRNAHLTPGSSRQYAAFYMLLLRADPAEQEAGASSGSAKAAGAANGQARAPKSRPTAARAQSAAKAKAAPDTATSATQNGPDSERPQPPRAHQARSGLEPSLNINVQIHIPAEASAEQIEQIFKSMAKHLYQRQDGADE